MLAALFIEDNECQDHRDQPLYRFEQKISLEGQALTVGQGYYLAMYGKTRPAYHKCTDRHIKRESFYACTNADAIRDLERAEEKFLQVFRQIKALQREFEHIKKNREEHYARTNYEHGICGVRDRLDHYL